jgi:hypothetical protein
MLDDNPDEVFGDDVSLATSQPRSHNERQRQRSTSGNHGAAATNPSRTSLRYCLEPGVLAAASNVGANGYTPAVEEYMQPIELTNERKYDDVAESE